MAVNRCSDLIFSPGFSLSLGMTQLVAFIGILVWQRQHQARSRRGDDRSSRLIITPAYVCAVWALGLTLVLYGIGNIVFKTRPYISDYTVAEGIYWAFNAFVFHFVLDGIGIFFCLEGTGTASLRRAALLSAIWALFIGVGHGLSLAAALWAPDGDLDYGLGVQNITEGITEIFYLALAFLPFRWLPRRPAIIFYAIAWAVYRPIYVVLLNLMYYGYDPSFCAYAGFSWVVWGVAKPLVLYHTLCIDSLYWQGLYTGGRWGVGFGAGRKRSRQSKSKSKRGDAAQDEGDDNHFVSEEADIRKPLLGTSFDSEAAVALSVGMDQMSQGCPILPFSALAIVEGKRHRSLGARAIARVIGAGGTARVFEGVFQGKSVAIKMLYCVTLVPETIHNFARENALLCSIRHPNIVQVEGICVVPPCICSVMELCSCSLFELLQQDAARYYDWGTRLSLAIDCANAVACLHSKGIVHMDLKSSNFLVGAERVSSWTTQDVKLWLETEGFPEFKPDFAAKSVKGWGADPRTPGLMQLTEDQLRRIVPSRRQGRGSRFAELLARIVALQEAAHRHAEQQAVVKLTDLELSLRDRREAAIRSGHASSAATPAGSPSASGAIAAAPIQVPQTPNWTAPEVMQRGAEARTPAADVYSLAMTLWEVFTGQVPFDEDGVSQNDIARLVCEYGERPFLPPHADPTYARLLRRGWAQDPAERPTAAEVRDELMRMRKRWCMKRALAHGRITDDNEDGDGSSVYSGGDGSDGRRGSGSGGHLSAGSASAGAAGGANGSSSPHMTSSDHSQRSDAKICSPSAGATAAAASLLDSDAVPLDRGKSGSLRSGASLRSAGSTRSAGSAGSGRDDTEDAGRHMRTPMRKSAIAVDRAALEAQRTAPPGRRPWLPMSSDHDMGGIAVSLSRESIAEIDEHDIPLSPRKPPRAGRRRSHARSVSDSAIEWAEMAKGVVSGGGTAFGADGTTVLTAEAGRNDTHSTQQDEQAHKTRDTAI